MKITADRQKRSSRGKRLAVFMVFFGIAASVLFGFPEIFLRIAHTPTRCDAIVLLGGSTGERDGAAFDLYQRHFAERIIVTGEGDCLDNFRLLQQRGVPTNAILLECHSRSTKENAEYTSRLCVEYKLTNVIVVTSWYHSRRALCTFRKFAPQLTIASCVADRHLPFKYEVQYVASEYIKILYYALRWQVPPWT